MKHLFAAFVFAVLFAGSAHADTHFIGGSTNNIFSADSWDNGFPSVTNGNGFIGGAGVYVGEAFDFSATNAGVVTVSHTNGVITGSVNWNVRNDAAGGTTYEWNHSGGALVAPLVVINNRLTYTLSEAGSVAGTATAGARIEIVNSGVFRQTGGTIVDMGIDVGNGTTVELSGGMVTNCGVHIASQALFADGSNASVIRIGGDHTIAFATNVPADGLVVLSGGGKLVFDLEWAGSWMRDGFTEADWGTALAGTTIGGLLVTEDNFREFFAVANAGSAGSSVSLSSQAGTTFLGKPGTDVLSGANWNKGLPTVATGEGIILIDGTYGGALDLNESAAGTVTVMHASGSITGLVPDWDVRNDAADGAVYEWNQTGGRLATRLLVANSRVRYTLSGIGVISDNGSGGARIQPGNSGVFRQLGGTLLNMGIEAGNGSTIDLVSGGAVGCGLRIPSQALWAHGSSASEIRIGTHYSVSFATGVSAVNAVLLGDGASLVLAPDWLGAWTRDGFTEHDWLTALTDVGTTIDGTQVTPDSFAKLFVVGRAGGVGACVQLRDRFNPATPELPVVVGASLTAHFDASDMNDDGGATDPGSHGTVVAWTDLVSGGNMIRDVSPTFIVAGNGGIDRQDTVRFRATADGGDLVYGNALSFKAQTIIAVVTMADNGSGGLSTLLSDAHAGNSIRQTTADAAAYFSGNGGDFLIQNSTGFLHINGSQRLDIPGGCGAAHVVKAVRNSAVTYDGFRFSDNVRANRRWNGDIAEVLVYDGKLIGNDAATINGYLEEKYGIPQVVDERITNTVQVADQPFRDADLRHIGVNFYYAPGGEAAGTLHGVAFDNIDCTGLPSGPIALTRCSPEATLSLSWSGFDVDNTPRVQTAAMSGPDAQTANEVSREMFYLGATHHTGVTLTFSGLTAACDVYLQVLGGDSLWSGDVAVTANGQSVGDWMSVSDGSGETASLFAFRSTTDVSGQLALRFEGVKQFSGIGGLIITEGIPKREGMTLIVR